MQVWSIVELVGLSLSTYARYLGYSAQDLFVRWRSPRTSLESSGKEMRRLIVLGLWNYGSPKQRHSVGNFITRKLAEKRGLRWEEKGGLMSIANDEKIVLVEPKLFMNESGKCVAQCLKSFGKIQDLVVVHDDLERAIGKVSVKNGGSANGHNGIRSIIQSLGSQDFRRVRVGIGRPVQGVQVAQFVLQSFTPQELGKLPVDQAIDTIEKMIPN